MSMRLIEIVLPEHYTSEVNELLKEQKTLEVWLETIEENKVHLKLLVQTEFTEGILDLLEKRFSVVEGFRMILLPVEAVIPRPNIEEITKEQAEPSEPESKPISKILRVSREELYDDIQKTVRYSWIFLLMIIFSAIVASIGILRDNVVFIIGAMVIAPFLGPNVALSFATALGDIDLAKKAIKAIAAGVLIAFALSVLIGFVFDVYTEIPELLSRTQVSLGDVILALVAGSAAVLSITSELFSALIGVMVAVALLPPLVSLGMLVGSGNWKLALGSLLLFLINLICVNLAGVVTFFVLGIRPLTWWEANKAAKATRIAIILWTIILVAFVIILLLS